MKRNLDHENKVYIYFIDFEKAFDRVNWIKMFEILKKLACRLERLNIIRRSVYETRSRNKDSK